jgi:hypothetical protein
MKKYVLTDLKKEQKIVARQKENEEKDNNCYNSYYYNTDFRNFLSRK